MTGYVYLIEEEPIPGENSGPWTKIGFQRIRQSGEWTQILKGVTQETYM